METDINKLVSNIVVELCDCNQSIRTFANAIASANFLLS